MISLRRRLLRSLLVGQTALLLAGGLLLFFVVRKALLREFDETLIDRTHSFIMATEVENNTIEYELAGQPPREGRSGMSAEFFQVRDAQGKTLIKSAALGASDLPEAEIDGKHSAIESVTLPNRERGRYLTWRFHPQNPQNVRLDSGELRLTMAMSRAGLDRTLRIIGFCLFSGTLLLPAATAAVAIWAVQTGMKPLDEIAGQTSRIGARDLSFRFPTHEQPLELRPIAQGLNDLLARIETAFHRERRFSSNVAHELRTPISELSLLADVGVSEAGLGTDRAFFTDVKSIALRMKSLVNTLLRISRCQAGIEYLAKEPLDAVALIQEAAKAEARSLIDRDLSLTLPDTASTLVFAERSVLSAILANLFSNAARYTPRGGRIECHLEKQKRTAVIRLRNTNPGLTEENLTQMFEPFWRADSSHADPDHSGLGLNLVEAYAHLLGAPFAINLEEPDWICFSLELPLARRASASARKPELTPA